MKNMMENAKKAAAMLGYLANPARLMILCLLAEGEKPVGHLIENTGISQSSASQHLQRLREAGLVRSEKRGQQVFYSLASIEVQALLSVLHLIYCLKR